MKNQINQRKLNNAYYMLLLLSRPPIQKILDSIPKEGATGTEIWIKCRTLEQPTLSNHLKELSDYDLVYQVREGKNHRFFKNTAKFLKINYALKKAKENGVIS
jgi:DNA-binding transcriptional ArsR family regulator